MSKGNMIQMDEVQFDGFGEPYIERWVPSSNKWKRSYGEIHQCIRCGKDFFYYKVKRGRGEHCSQRCFNLYESKREFDSIQSKPYDGTVDWSYVAGFFDGEGCIIWHLGRTCQAKFTQNDRTVLLELQRFLLSFGIKSGISTAYTTRAPASDLYISNMFGIEEFLLHLLDYTIVKKDSIIESLEMFEVMSL